MTEQPTDATLLPCPFCAKALRRSSNRNLWWHPGVATDSDCVLSGRGIRPDQLAAWNTRTMQAAAPTPNAMRAALVKARPYVEQAGFRHHDVSGLLSEIDEALGGAKVLSAPNGEGETIQDSWHNPVHQIALRAGFLLCREYMARFVEAVDPVTANSIRLNWIPAMGDDPGPPRRFQFDECVVAEDMENGPWEAKDPGLALEAACYAFCAMSEFGLDLREPDAEAPKEEV